MSRRLILSSLSLVAMISTACQEAIEGDLPRAATRPSSDDEFPPIEIIDAAMAGNGCPPGSAGVLFIDNTLSVLFSRYQARTSAGYQTDYKSCNFGVTLRVSAGYSIALVKIDYRGFADIPEGGYGWFRREYFWAGTRGPVVATEFPPEFLDSWMESDYTGGDVWSPCGVDVIARGNTSATARKESPDSAYETLVQLDTLDLGAEIIYYFDYDTCDE